MLLKLGWIILNSFQEIKGIIKLISIFMQINNFILKDLNILLKNQNLMYSLNPISTRGGLTENHVICPIMVNIECWRFLTFPQYAQRSF